MVSKRNAAAVDVKNRAAAADLTITTALAVVASAALEVLTDHERTSAAWVRVLNGSISCTPGGSRFKKGRTPSGASQTIYMKPSPSRDQQVESSGNRLARRV